MPATIKRGGVGGAMQDRLNQNDVTNRVNVEEPGRVHEEVHRLLCARYPGFDFQPLTAAFDDFRALFEGRYAGYLACDTLYHDMRHTLDMSLAAARMIEGHDRSHAGADRLGPERALLGVIVALFHDSGYIKRASEAEVENGAIFTKIHVSRSADFLSRYLPAAGLAERVNTAAKIVHFTGYELSIGDIHFDNAADRTLGGIVGTADLIAQMSDRLYLEKCHRFLYEEFVFGSVARETTLEGKEIVRYQSADDLIIKTPGFYEYVARKRIEKELGQADRYAEAHFDGLNPYQSEIDRNIAFLRGAIEAGDLRKMKRLCYSLSRKDKAAA